MRLTRQSFVLVAALLLLGGVTRGQTDQQLGEQVENPISRLIRFPILFDYDRGLGPDSDGNRLNLLTLQPIVPVALNHEWNLILNANIRMVYQSDILKDSGTEFGLGDLTQAIFLSPEKPEPGRIVWGVGPVLLFPSATNDLLGAGKWGAGPAAAVVKQDGPWTIGFLGHHLWSFSGDSDRPEVNRSFLQPFISYTTPDAWTISLNSEALYNWESREWLIPINLQLSKIVRIGRMPVSIGVGVRYWAESTPTGPEGFGARVSATFLFPRE